MTEPTTLEEYQRLYLERTEYTGAGPTTGMTVPCPFCCAPKFMHWTVWPGTPDHVEIVMTRGATCSSCQRGIRALFTRDANGVSFEMVQTCGPDAPAFLPPMRRDPTVS